MATTQEEEEALILEAWPMIIPSQVKPSQTILPDSLSNMAWPEEYKIGNGLNAVT